MMTTPEFSQWLSATRLYLDKLRDTYDDPQMIFNKLSNAGYYGINDIHNIAPDGDHNHLSKEGSLKQLQKEHGLKFFPPIEMSLFLFGTLKQYFREFEEPSNKKTLIPQADEALMELREYVITGEKIWSQQGKFTIPKLGVAAIAGIFFPDDKNRPDWTYPLLQDNLRLKSPYEKEETSLSVDRWTTYEISLFLKDNCDYALMLSLGNYENAGTYMDVMHDPARWIVIPDISGLQLFDELDEMREWLNLPELPLDEMKTDIAKYGGYVPGAVVI